MKQGYNIQRVQKVNMLAIIGIALSFIISILVAGAPFSATYSAFVVIVLTLVIYFTPMNNYVKGYIFAVLPVLSTTMTLLMGGFALSSHYIYFVAIGIISLYFERRLLLIFGASLNVIYIGMFFISTEKFISATGKTTHFISTMVMLNGVMLLLYFLTKWGKESIDQAVESGIKANAVMASLSTTMERIEEGTVVLSESTTEMTSNATETLNSSKDVAEAMEEITTGVQEQAESVTEINVRVMDMSENIEVAYNISQNITEYNSKMMDAVSTGEVQVKEMSDQMTIIYGAINAAIVTVSDLEAKLGDIQNFLQVITSISSQTNLLALNASIESARAGEAGKGFAVVADEIRKLAEQTAESANDISEIVTVVGEKSREAVEKVNKGNEAVDQGADLIGRITSQYTSIKETFEESNTELEREIEMISQINESFSVVNTKIMNIASISEEQSASSEQILSTVENQKINIQSLTDSLMNIDNLSESLTILIEEHNKNE